LARRVRSFKRLKAIERGKAEYRPIYPGGMICYKVSHNPILLVINPDPTGKAVGLERAAVTGLWLYSAVWLWHLQWGQKRNALRMVAWNPDQSRPSFQDALAAL